MDLSCTDIAKKYKREQLFSGFTYHFKQGQHYAILGPNSSGKSTLLKMLAGLVEPTAGSVEWRDGDRLIEDNHYAYYSFSSPEMDLYIDFTVTDMVDLHFSLKKCKTEQKTFWSETELELFKHKAFGELSSGLQNKIKLSLALFTETPVLLLDEPCTNFDENNTAWYHTMVQRYCDTQLIVVASNQEHEYFFCPNRVDLKHYKQL
jgi:ABC-type multidrug transport system ATPase subunit